MYFWNKLICVVPHYIGKTSLKDLKPALLSCEKFLSDDILDSVDNHGAEFKLWRRKWKDYGVLLSDAL